MNPLAKLHDFDQPVPPSWIPQTIGWYVVFALLALLIVWMAWRVMTNWRRNRYRSEALRELETAEISEIPALLKRTALAAWPRERVASLTGEQWLAFLDAHGKRGSFSTEPGKALLDVAYRSVQLSPDQASALRKVAREWIRGHRVRT